MKLLNRRPEDEWLAVVSFFCLGAFFLMVGVLLLTGGIR